MATEEKSCELATEPAEAAATTETTVQKLESVGVSEADLKQKDNVAEELEEGEIPLEKTHPLLVELSRRNGQINRMNVAQMRNELRTLKLTTFGTKQVLRKRLKAAALRSVLKDCSDQNVRNKLVGRNRPPRFLVVMDFEATCGEHGNVPTGEEGKKPKVAKKETGATFTERLRQVRDSMARSSVSNEAVANDEQKVETSADQSASVQSVAPLKQLAQVAVQEISSGSADSATAVADAPVRFKGGDREQVQEIIEFPAYFVDTHELRVIGAPFHCFVRPSHATNLRLTQFCTALTGIVQSDVDCAPSFPEVLVTFKRWLVAMLKAHDPRVIRRFGLVTTSANESQAQTAGKADVNNNSNSNGNTDSNEQNDTRLNDSMIQAVDLNNSFMETALMHLRALQAANETVSCMLPPRSNDSVESMQAMALSSVQLGEQEEQILQCGDFAVVFDSAVDVSMFLRKSAEVCGVPVPQFMREWVNLKKCYCNFYTLPKTNLSEMLRSVQLDFVGRAHRGRDDAHNLARLALRLVEDGAALRKNERLLNRPASDRNPKAAEANVHQVRVRFYEPIRSDPYARRKRHEPREAHDQDDDRNASLSDDDQETADADNQDDLLYLHSLKRTVHA